MTSQNVLSLNDLKVSKELTIAQLRSRLRPADSLDQLSTVRDILIDRWEELGKNQIDALKTRIDLEMRLLNKTLPDLKVMDHQMGESASKVNFVINLNGPNNETVVKTL